MNKTMVSKCCGSEYKKCKHIGHISVGLTCKYTCSSCGKACEVVENNQSKEKYCKNLQCQRLIGYQGNRCTNTYCEFSTPQVEKEEVKLEDVYTLKKANFTNKEIKEVLDVSQSTTLGTTMEWEEEFDKLGDFHDKKCHCLFNKESNDWVYIDGDCKYQKAIKFFTQATQEAKQQGYSDGDICSGDGAEPALVLVPVN